MLPILERSAERLWTMRDLISRIADDLGLTTAEREEMIPSGTTTLIANRIHWAKTYLKQAGLVEQPKRAHVQISPNGRSVLARRPQRIDAQLLQEFGAFRDFLTRTKSADSPRRVSDTPTATTIPLSSTMTATPEEQIVSASLVLESALHESLIERVLEGSPSFFEKIIVDLLLAMGYGGSRSDAGERLGGTADGGIDGVIREDQLGLDRIYLQAKRYAPTITVGSETVHAFMGALVARNAQKGVLITTSTFTKPAREVAGQQGHLRLVLIDGEELTRLMVRFDVGVRVARTVEIKRIDLDYFETTDTE